MNQKKSTKRTLITSALSLVLCMAMLIGTTFAWFTDNVTSAGNIIKAGKLDAELNYKTTLAEDWKDASEGAIFNYDLWEPGYVDAKYVQVANVGNLAFKYRLNIVPETPVAAGKVNLADVIDVYIVAEPTADITRGSLASMKKVGTLSQLMADADGAAYGILLPKEGSKKVELAPEDEAIAVTEQVTLGIALKMQEAAGNEYQELSVGGGFRVELLATQYTWEEDDFDNQYDANAKYTGEVGTVEELQAALNAGGRIKLLNDISSDSESPLLIPEGVSVVLDLNGKTLKNTTTMVLRNSGNLTLTGEGTVQGSMGGYAIRSDKGSVTVDEGTTILGGFGAMSLFGNTKAVVNNATFTAEGATAKTCHLIFASGSSTLEINGGTYTHNTSEKIDSGHVVTSMGTANVSINAGTFKGGYQGNVSEYSNDSNIAIYGGTFEQNPKEFVAEGYTAVNNADGTYSVVYGKAASNATDLNNLLAKGGTAVLANDISAPLSGSAIYGTPVALIQKNGGTIDGNGHSLDIKNPEYNGYAIETYGGTIKNLTIDSTVGRGIVISSPKEDIYLENVVIDGPGYAINTTEPNGKNLVVTNSTVNGWTSFAGLDSVTFNACKFGENTAKYWQNMGYDQDYDRLIRPYVSTEFKGCVFEKGFYLDLSALGANCVVTLDNCTVNGTVLTADNYTGNVTIELPEGRTVADCVVFK